MSHNTEYGMTGIPTDGQYRTVSLELCRGTPSGDQTEPGGKTCKGKETAQQDRSQAKQTRIVATA